MNTTDDIYTIHDNYKQSTKQAVGKIIRCTKYRNGFVEDKN